ncbi:MAG: hypothetical protein A2Y73_06040 [Chloroflexi bacterium RBG_13_56_8]|nr:MAG: hypothetical protein A2Y73_06040 [Chloroflexi bacterium RBG_13_56_8]
MARKNNPTKMLEREKQRVLEQISRLRGELQGEIERASGTDDDAAADAAADIYEREKTISQLQTLDDKVRALNHAIALAAKGQYGICEMCGQTIPEERLEIVPETTLCVNCASQMERGIRRHQIQMQADARARSPRRAIDSDIGDDEADEDE